MILSRYTKQPVEVKDYDIDYGEWLAPVADDLDEVHTTVECLSDPADTSLQVDSAPFTATTVKLWISGGTHGARYKVTVTGTTTYERVDQCELIFTVKEI